MQMAMKYNASGEEQQKKGAVFCPYCNSDDTELFSLFGQQLLTVQYYCNMCHTPFECVKDDDILDDYNVEHYAARKDDQS